MDPEVWRWIWLVAAATFVVGEIARYVGSMPFRRAA